MLFTRICYQFIISLSLLCTLFLCSLYFLCSLPALSLSSSQSVRGYGCALVALCSLSAELPAGVPHRLLEEVFDTGAALLLPTGAYYCAGGDACNAAVRRTLPLLGWQVQYQCGTV